MCETWELQIHVDGGSIASNKYHNTLAISTHVHRIIN
jgi:hypothetical protein